MNVYTHAYKFSSYWLIDIYAFVQVEYAFKQLMLFVNLYFKNISKFFISRTFKQNNQEIRILSFDRIEMGQDDSLSAENRFLFSC
jgi:hypothetical protein